MMIAYLGNVDIMAFGRVEVLHKQAIVVLLLFMTVLACQSEVASTSTSLDVDLAAQSGLVEITDVSGNVVARPTTYAVSSFSEYVYFDTANHKILLDWDFFPSTRYDSTEKTLTLPCEASVEITSADGLNYSESVPLTTEACATDVVVDLAEATFEVYGLVFAFDDSFTALQDDLGFSITKNGFQNPDGTSITLDSADEADLIAVAARL